MNKEIVAQLMPLIEKTKEGITKAIEVVQAEAPELIEQVLAWNFFVSLFWCVLGILPIVAGVMLIKYGNRECQNSVDSTAFCWALGGISYVTGFLMLIGNNVWIKILIAEKLFLIEYFSNLLK